MNNFHGDIENSEIKELPKLPFKRLKCALNQIVDVAIPLHVQHLKQHTENFEILKRDQHNDRELRYEQVKATKIVQLLKADLYELEKLNYQVREEDSDLFHDLTKSAIKDAIEILTLFMDLHADILTPLPEVEFGDTSAGISPLVCDFNEQNCYSGDTAAQEVSDLHLKQVQNVKSKFESLNFLQKELLEINALIKQFSRFVFRQKENVDSIQNNVELTSANVSTGAAYLRKASDYKAATFPLAGAILGGLILGPAGAFAGLKLFGSFACLAGGSVIGYGAGVKLKQKQQAFNEFEMKALTYSSKSQSLSSPDLLAENPEVDK